MVLNFQPFRMNGTQTEVCAAKTGPHRDSMLEFKLTTVSRDPTHACENCMSADAFEEFPRARIVLEALFLGAEFGGMRLKSARGSPQGMFYVEHLVKQN